MTRDEFNNLGGPIPPLLIMSKKARSPSIGLGQLTEELADNRHCTLGVQTVQKTFSSFFFFFPYQESSSSTLVVMFSACWFFVCLCCFVLIGSALTWRFFHDRSSPAIADLSLLWPQSLWILCSDSSLLISFPSVNLILHLHYIKVVGIAMHRCVSFA